MTVPLMRVIDLLILIVCLAVWWYVISRGLLRNRFFPGLGRWLVVLGLFMTLLLEGASILLRFMDPAVSYFRDPSFLMTNIPAPVHWLLSRSAYILIAFGVLSFVLHRKRAEEEIGRDRKDMIRAAQQSVRESESRFRYLLDTTGSAVYCFSFEPPLLVDASPEEQIRRSYDAKLIECNTPFVAALGLASSADALGVRLGDLDSARDANSHAKLIRAFIASGYKLQNYELVYTGPDGAEHALNISLTGIIENDRLLRIWGSETDIQDLRATKHALLRRRNFQDLIAGISSYMIMTPIERSDEIVERCLSEICQFVDAGRSSLLWINWQDESGNINYRWSHDNIETPDHVTLAEFPYLGEQVKSGRVIRLNDIEDLPDRAQLDKRRLQAWHMRSLVVLPLTIAGDVHGIVTFGTSNKHKLWSDQDILDLRVTAELFANFVGRLKSNAALGNALEELRVAKDRLEEENVYLREEIDTTHGFDEIVGNSAAILKTLRMVEMVACTDTPVLILGETGTGKELIARAIHQRSDRKDRPLVKVNCAALPENLIESELFGYEKGAFTGAENRKRGRFDLADGSTLFLDEFGELPLEVQTKLLRVLQEGEFERLGGTETIKVNARLIVATNRDLAEAVRNGSFRSDLYYRVNTFPIKVPPLRERDGDIEVLARHFVHQQAKKLGRDFSGMSASMMRQLNEYRWPGNVRELEGVIQRAAIANSGDFLELPEPLIPSEPVDDGPRIVSSTIADLSLVEREHIIGVLESTSWKISGPNGAARMLGLPPSTLRSKMKKLSIQKPH